MKRPNKPRRHLSVMMDQMRLHLARPDALLQLAVLGLLTGVVAGCVIVLFRFLVEYTQDLILPGSGAENYEGLTLWARLVFPLAGAVLLAIMFRWFAKGLYVLGVARVMERMAYHQGHFGIREFMLQFFGAAIAIISGHSVGREGPHIFLGAAAGSLLGQKLEVPNNTIRTLVGCGTAAGIAASFNTPLAGVIFSLEVVMLDYSLSSFIPIILSAVSATLISQAIIGSDASFLVPQIGLGSLKDVLFVVLLGLAAGAASAVFIHLIELTARYTRGIAIWWRVLLAGILVGIIGMMLPEIMGIGYDTVSATLVGQYGAAFLLTMALLKIVATSACIGMGIPGGMIGPALFIGATLGAALGHLFDQVLGGLSTEVGFFALLGMGAMMSASLQAPFAALTAMLELTDNPEIILPGMLAVVISGLTASELFRKKSLFITMLSANGMDYEQSPLMQALRRIGVASVMDKSFVSTPHQVSRQKSEALLRGSPGWIIIEQEQKPVALLKAAELAGHLQSIEDADPETVVDLLNIPGHRLELAPVHLHETLQEALERLNRREGEALYVRRMTAPGNWHVYGVLTRENVDSAYKY